MCLSGVRPSPGAATSETANTSRQFHLHWCAAQRTLRLITDDDTGRTPKKHQCLQGSSRVSRLKTPGCLPPCRAAVAPTEGGPPQFKVQPQQPISPSITEYHSISLNITQYHQNIWPPFHSPATIRLPLRTKPDQTGPKPDQTEPKNRIFRSVVPSIHHSTTPPLHHPITLHMRRAPVSFESRRPLAFSGSNLGSLRLSRMAGSSFTCYDRLSTTGRLSRSTIRRG